MDLREPAPEADDNRPATLNPEGWPRPRGYANGMMGRGTVLVTGGLIGWDVEERIADGFLAQARQVFENIVAILAAGGAGPEHLIRMTWYVVDLEEYRSNLRELGAIYREVLGRNFPAMAVVGVSGLVEPAARLEIEATALIPDPD
jgi:enamine deaminase RidA (YjgF/YER057c/UK114 family)